MNDGFDGMLGLAVTASTHNAVLLDGNGQVIRHCIMWNDQRSGEQCRYLKEKHGEEIFKIGMQMPTPTWTLPQLQWVRENEPENYKKIRRLMFTKDYIRSWVTGDFCTDIVDAQGSLLFDARKQCWSEELCNMVGLPVEVLPEIRKTKEIVGTVREEVSKQTGLPGGLPVIAGCSDTAAEDFSAGAVKMVRLSLSWQLPAMSIWLQTRRCLTIRHLHTPILWKENGIPLRLPTAVRLRTAG